MEDGAFIFEFGELKVESASHGKARSEAFIDGFDLGGETITGNNDLLVELVESVENIEELLLGFFFTDNELKVVDNETVEGAEFLIEIFTFAVANRVYKIRVKVGNGGVKDFVIRVFL